jgi:tRNA/tmRNA/rRNA uracil-C5-methylase (TrmA/RlmC/RlmD family)
MNATEDSDTVELTISEVVYKGRGLARLDGFVVFVPGVLPDEVVKARITQRRKNFAEAELIEVVKPSASRKEPDCPLSAVCPGCCYLHSDYEEEIRIKQRQLEGFIGHVCKADVSVCGPPVASPIRLGYRNRITLHARTRENSALSAFGYIGQDNRTVLDIERCPLAAEPINDLLAKLRADETFMTSLLPAKSVTLRHTEESGACFWTSPNRHGKPDFVSSAVRRPVENTVLGALETPLTGFFQINPPVLNEILSHVMKILADAKPQALIDVYSGSGVFAIAAATVGISHVLGIELDSASVKAAVCNVKTRNMDNVLFLAQPAGRALQSALAEVTTANTTVIVDPPRTGLEGPVLKALVKNGPRDLVYVSCAADTLARDLKALMASGYAIQNSRLFDMFPCTSYFESVTHLQQAER